MSQVKKVCRLVWTAEDDEVIRTAVNSGDWKWTEIAQRLPSQPRTGKQCRERWNNYLDPRLKKSAWTSDEDQLLLDAQQHLGNSWTRIAQQLPGRSENEVKNRWYTVVMKLKDAQLKRYKNDVSLAKSLQLSIDTSPRTIMDSMSGPATDMSSMSIGSDPPPSIGTENSLDIEQLIIEVGRLLDSSIPFSPRAMCEDDAMYSRLAEFHLKSPNRISSRTPLQTVLVRYDCSTKAFICYSCGCHDVSRDQASGSVVTTTSHSDSLTMDQCTMGSSLPSFSFPSSPFDCGSYPDLTHLCTYPLPSPPNGQSSDSPNWYSEVHSLLLSPPESPGKHRQDLLDEPKA